MMLQIRVVLLRLGAAQLRLHIQAGWTLGKKKLTFSKIYPTAKTLQLRLIIGEYLTSQENKLPALWRTKNKKRRIRRNPADKMSPPLLPGMFDFNPSYNTCGEQSHLASPPITLSSLLTL
mmetsp:Transcript_16135/g.22522  ORF Transcript_16135/g.22522 Transcript_16135/m.22522 type:complete len:120 (+) Transcript_16135:349-708(+)